MKRIFSAEPVISDKTEISEIFDDKLDNISDDFDYVIDGLETLSRHSKDGQHTAIEIIDELSEAIANAMKAIADNIQEDA